MPVAERPLRVVVVDDEPPARRGLARMLASRDGVQIVGQCGDSTSAVRTIRERRPDLVLLDVQMTPHDGFSVLRELGAEAVPAVIFVTAHERFALAAFEHEVLDYLLKPFSEPRLDVALRRARAALDARSALRLASPARSTAPDRIVVRGLGRVDIVRIDDILRIDATGYCVTLHTGARQFVHREPIRTLEARLPADRFIRVHRSTIVHIAHVSQVRSTPAGGHEVVLRDGGRHGVSRRRWGRVAALLSRWDEPQRRG